MKYFNLALFSLTFLLFSCSNKSKPDQEQGEKVLKRTVQSHAEVDEPDVAEVYYFHGTRRCETCKAVGRIAKGYTKIHYKPEIDKGIVKVIEINYDEAGNEALVEKYEVTRSSLIVRTVKNNHEEVVNLTEIAFLNAGLHPEIVREAIKNEIELVVN